jgi:3-phosphoshikimate 1-carboxyvinyltransferase
VNQISDKVILILGLGLIGGSIARGLKKANPDQVILAVDTNQAALEKAQAEKIIDRSGELKSLCAEADVVIVALPVMTAAEFLPEIASSTEESTTVTDVASVKSHIIESVNRLDSGFVRRFVPGHPIAGSEKSGYCASRDDLFLKRNVILTPQAITDPVSVALVNELWRTLGANVLGMDLSRHDEVLAATSHLPHLLAYAIVDVVQNQQQSKDIFRYAAGGFADFSRLASSDAKMWSDIFVTNADATLKVLESYIQTLRELKKSIENRDHPRLMHTFSQAKAVREKFMQSHFITPAETVTAEAGISLEVQPGGTINGILRVPGDKSISHRSIICAAIADGITHVSGFLEGEDALNTVAAFREMGVTIIGPEDGELTIYGVGRDGLKAPREPLYMGNSGTAMRLLAGLLAAQSFSSELCGDESLSNRPMSRVAEPLREMGAVIDTASNGTPPLHITGSPLQGIHYEMKIASAQVKSCLLLAGLYAAGNTEVTEPASCRDHTERMLRGFGYPVVIDSAAKTVSLTGGHTLQAMDIDIPADISSAAFFIVAAAISPGSSLTLEHVGVNPTRIGIINLLQAMGADIQLSNERESAGEPVADITVVHRPLRGIVIPQEQIPLAIDEFPVLFVAASCAEGETVLKGAAELRVKESDRIDAMAQGLKTLGITCETYADGIRIVGGELGGGEIDSHADHRIAMAFIIAGLRASSTIRVANCANVATSFPGFVECARQVGIDVTQQVAG